MPRDGGGRELDKPELFGRSSSSTSGWLKELTSDLFKTSLCNGGRAMSARRVGYVILVFFIVYLVAVPSSLFIGVLWFLKMDGTFSALSWAVVLLPWWFIHAGQIVWYLVKMVGVAVSKTMRGYQTIIEAEIVAMLDLFKVIMRLLFTIFLVIERDGVISWHWGAIMSPIYLIEIVNFAQNVYAFVDNVPLCIIFMRLTLLCLRVVFWILLILRMSVSSFSYYIVATPLILAGFCFCASNMMATFPPFHTVRKVIKRLLKRGGSSSVGSSGGGISAPGPKTDLSWPQIGAELVWGWGKRVTLLVLCAPLFSLYYIFIILFCLRADEIVTFSWAIVFAPIVLAILYLIILIPAAVVAAYLYSPWRLVREVKRERHSEKSVMNILPTNEVESRKLDQVRKFQTHSRLGLDRTKHDDYGDNIIDRLRKIDARNASEQMLVLQTVYKMSLDSQKGNDLIAGGMIAVLVSKLRTWPFTEVRTMCCGILANLAFYDGVGAQIIAERDALDLLSTLVGDSTRSELQAEALRCIGNLTEDHNNREKIVRDHPMTSIAELLYSKDDDLVANCCTLLANLSQTVDLGREVVLTKALPRLVALLESRSAEIVREACRALGNIAAAEEGSAAVCEETTGVEALLKLVETNSDPLIRRSGAYALSNLAVRPANRHHFIAANIRERIAPWLNASKDLEMQRFGTSIVRNLSLRDPTPPTMPSTTGNGRAGSRASSGKPSRKTQLGGQPPWQSVMDPPPNPRSPKGAHAPGGVRDGSNVPLLSRHGLAEYVDSESAAPPRSDADSFSPHYGTEKTASIDSGVPEGLVNARNDSIQRYDGASPGGDDDTPPLVKNPNQLGQAMGLMKLDDQEMEGFEFGNLGNDSRAQLGSGSSQSRGDAGGVDSDQAAAIAAKAAGLAQVPDAVTSQSSSSGRAPVASEKDISPKLEELAGLNGFSVSYRGSLFPTGDPTNEHMATLPEDAEVEAKDGKNESTLGRSRTPVERDESSGALDGFEVGDISPQHDPLKRDDSAKYASPMTLYTKRRESKMSEDSLGGFQIGDFTGGGSGFKTGPTSPRRDDAESSDTLGDGFSIEAVKAPSKFHANEQSNASLGPPASLNAPSESVLGDFVIGDIGGAGESTGTLQGFSMNLEASPPQEKTAAADRPTTRQSVTSDDGLGGFSMEFS